ncbi:MAG: Aspartate/tyrosine/aromatic aminotransferase [Francisellaceae bacterium]|nr:Aspartate/tyrosine/aromatic aminotransferase [Francisellaceae bacterium]
MNSIIADRVKLIKPSATLSIAAKAASLKAAGKDIISLSVGEPDFDTPNHIKEAAIQAIKEGFTKYTAVEGILPLREAIKVKFARDNGLNYETNQILVSTGGKQSIFNLAQSLLNKDDEVLIPAPYWVSYPDIVLLSDAKPVIIQTQLENNFKITPAQLKASISSKTKLLILNSPSNPCGVAYSKEELEALGEVLRFHPNIFILSDDIYEQVLWQPEYFSNIVMSCPDLYDRMIIVHGVSKSYSMTGWRIGFAAGPKWLIDAMTNVQSQCTSNACSISQKAALAALTGPQDSIALMRASFKSRHDYVLGRLNTFKNTTAVKADGAFYLFPRFDNISDIAPNLKDDIDLASYLLSKAGIALVPGTAFGNPGYLRLSFALGMPSLEKALDRLEAILGKK